MSAPRLLGWTSCVALLSGCASFSDLPPRPTHSPPSGATPPSVHLTTAEKAFLQAGRGWIEFLPTGLAEVAADAIRDSEWVRVTAESDGAPTLEMEMTEYQSDGPGLIVVLTGFVIPGMVDHHFDLKLSLSKSSDAKSTCTRAYDERTWYQTFLIFVYPFRSPAYKRMKAAEALALQCLAELLEGRDERPAAALPNTEACVRIE
jgi:hypothetical protein